MTQAISRYLTLLGGMLLTGAICNLAAGFMRSPRGTLGPTVLQAANPISAIIAVVLCIAASAVVAIVVGRMINTAVGLFVLGTGIWVLAARCETIEALAFAEGSLRLAGIETLLWGVLILAASLFVFKGSGALADVHERDDESPVGPLSRRGLLLASAGALILPAMWLIAQSPMKGQVTMAACIGGLVAGLAGRMASPHTQPVLLFATPVFFAGIGQIVASFMIKQPLDIAFVTNAIPRFALPMPVDIAAGSVVGVAMGLGWAKSFLHHEETQPRAVANRA